MHKEEVKNVQDMAAYMYETMGKMREVTNQQPNADRTNEILQKATGADGRFLANELIKLVGMLDNVMYRLKYINTPIECENKVLLRDGRYCIGEKALEPGNVIEIFEDGIWKIGMLEADSSMGTMYFVQESGGTKKEVKPGLVTARKRKY